MVDTIKKANRLNEKILGISDSRPPGSFLSSSDAARILKDFGIMKETLKALMV